MNDNRPRGTGSASVRALPVFVACFLGWQCSDGMRTIKCLLMGGQACVLYGAAEFSRDTDLTILSDADNLARLNDALGDLQAACIAVRPYEPKYLAMGLAVHFRCHHPDAEGMRIDIMSKMRLFTER